MGKRGRGLECSLVDLTPFSLHELAALDEEVLEEALRRLLRACGGGLRLWNLNIVPDVTS